MSMQINGTNYQVTLGTIFFLFAGVLLGCGSTSSTQETPVAPTTQADADGAYVMVEEMPRLIGGLGELQRDVKFPQALRDNCVRGRVLVQFVVNEKGKPQDLKVIRSLHPEADEAAIRAVSRALFEPGKVGGEPVPVKMSLPITFR